MKSTWIYALALSGSASAAAVLEPVIPAPTTTPTGQYDPACRAVLSGSEPDYPYGVNRICPNEPPNCDDAKCGGDNGHSQCSAEGETNGCVCCPVSPPDCAAKDCDSDIEFPGTCKTEKLKGCGCWHSADAKHFARRDPKLPGLSITDPRSEVTCNGDKTPWSREVPKDWLLKVTKEWCEGADFQARTGCKAGDGGGKKFKGRHFDTNCRPKPDDFLTKTAKGRNEVIEGFMSKDTVVSLKVQLYTGYFDLNSEKCKNGFKKIAVDCKNLKDGGGFYQMWSDTGNMVFQVDSHSPERP